MTRLLNAWTKFAYRHFGRIAARDVERNRRLESTLLKAAIPMRAEAYLASLYLLMAATTLLSVVLFAGGVIVAVAAGVVLRIPALLLTGVALTILPFGSYTIAHVWPETVANSRAKRIDADLSYALNYVASLAAAGVPPAKIFSSLASQKVFGEVSREAAFISRDLNALGKDLVSALNDAKERTPSIRFQDVLQGTVTALTSGVDIKQYFAQKSEQYAAENRLIQKQQVDNLGILAEAFVTVVVAGPTFLLVLFSIMANVGPGATGSLLFGYLLIIVMIPLAQLGFSVAMASGAPGGN